MTAETVPNAPGKPQSWADAPSLIQIEACQQGGQRGAQVWGITSDGALISTRQSAPGGDWTQWIYGAVETEFEGNPITDDRRPRM